MEKLNFDRRCRCDYCNQIEICSLTHYGTTNYTRIICLECALDIQQKNKIYGRDTFDLNNSNIRFKELVYYINEDTEREEEEDDGDE